MSQEDLVINMFCIFDDELKAMNPGRLRERGPAPKLRDAEVLAIVAAGELLGFQLTLMERPFRARVDIRARPRGHAALIPNSALGFARRHPVVSNHVVGGDVSGGSCGSAAEENGSGSPPRSLTKSRRASWIWSLRKT